jgi:hypothetical protein
VTLDSDSDVLGHGNRDGEQSIVDFGFWILD